MLRECPDRPPVHEGHYPGARVHVGRVAVILSRLTRQSASAKCKVQVTVSRSDFSQRAQSRRPRVSSVSVTLCSVACESSDGGPRLDSAQLLSLTGALRGKQVVVIGDVVADEFVYGRVARVSREAPVLILEYDSSEIVPGGAGNAANNSPRSAAARRSSRSSDATSRAAASCRRCTGASIAASPARGGDADAGQDAHPRRRHSLGQTAGRPDRSRRGASSHASGARRRSSARRSRPSSSADAVLVSDYGSGLVTPALVQKIRRGLQRARRADSRPDRHTLPAARATRGLTACTPNESEVEQALGVQINDDTACARAGRPRDPRAHAHAGGARSPAAAAAWRSSSAMGRSCTFRSSAPTPSSTSPAPATPSCDGDAGARGGRRLRSGGAPGQLRRRSGGDEAGHRHRQARRAARAISKDGRG